MAVLSLYHLQAYYSNEWERGLAGMGEFTLQSHFALSLKIPEDEMLLLHTSSLTDLISSLKQSIINVPDDVCHTDDSCTQTANDWNNSDSDSECQEMSQKVNTGDLFKKDDENGVPVIFDEESSQMARAKLLVKNGLVSLDSKMKTFTVYGSKGKPNAVSLYPNEFCSCPSSSQCYHLLAVKLSIGMQSEKRKKVNLTQLRWNTRSRRSFLVQFMEQNLGYFSAYCNPASVSDHTKRMRNNYVWGTHCEIVAAALLFKVPIFVAIRKNNGGPYYWAKFSRESKRHNPQEFHVPEGAEKLTPPSHMELCHLKDHYNIILCITTSRLPQTYPYHGDKSSNCENVVLD